MARLRFPLIARKHLVALSVSSEEQIAQLHSALTELNPDLSPEEVPEKLVSKLSLWKGDSGREVVQAILGLCSYRAQVGQKAADLINDVVVSLKRSDGLQECSEDDRKAALLTDTGEEKLRTVLAKLCSIDVLDITAKALGVLTDNQRSFVSARILSDIRPIFRDDAETGPMAAVIVHSLKIDYSEAGRRDDVYVALDSKDLLAMQQVIIRALVKDKALKAILKDTQIAVLENK